MQNLVICKVYLTAESTVLVCLPTFEQLRKLAAVIANGTIGRARPAIERANNVKLEQQLCAVLLAASTADTC